MSLSINDPIAALATGFTGDVRGIIRISGSRSWEAISAFIEDSYCDLNTIANHSSHQFWKLSPTDPSSRKVPVRVYSWPTTRSYSGEPLIEIHAPGSPVLLERMLEQIFSRGIRPARKGEFTLRAFLSGKLDLVQAEAVLGVIESDDASELRSALTQLAGGISRKFGVIRDDLLNLQADLEAGLDFTDEGLTFVSVEEIKTRIENAISFLEEILTQSSERMWHQELPEVILTGETNAGKSSLFNALIGDSVSIISEEPGTTRDLNSQIVCWDGISLRLIDTAGDEESPSEVIQEAFRLRDERIRRALLRVECHPANSDPRVNFSQQARSGATLEITTKGDLLTKEMIVREESEVGMIQFVSVRMGWGIEELKREILRKIRGAFAHQSLIGSTAARCRHSLETAVEALKRGIILVEGKAGDELVAEELRSGLDGLGEVTGSVYTEDLLDRIFSRFCIGK